MSTTDRRVAPTAGTPSTAPYCLGMGGTLGGDSGGNVSPARPQDGLNDPMVSAPFRPAMMPSGCAPMESIDEDEEIDMWNEVASRMYFSGGLVTPRKQFPATPHDSSHHQCHVGEWVDGYATLFASPVEDMEVLMTSNCDKPGSQDQPGGFGGEMVGGCNASASAMARVAAGSLQATTQCVAAECVGNTMGTPALGNTSVLFAASPSQSYLCACRSPAASLANAAMSPCQTDGLLADASVRVEPLQEPSNAEIPWNDLVFWLGDQSTGEVKCVCASCLNSLCGGNRLPLIMNLSAKIPVISAMPRIEGVN